MSWTAKTSRIPLTPVNLNTDNIFVFRDLGENNLNSTLSTLTGNVSGGNVSGGSRRRLLAGGDPGTYPLFAGLKNLKTLLLDKNNFSGVIEWESFQDLNLETLNMSNNNVVARKKEDYAAILYCPGLLNLSLSENQIEHFGTHDVYPFLVSVCVCVCVCSNFVYVIFY